MYFTLPHIPKNRSEPYEGGNGIRRATSWRSQKERLEALDTVEKALLGGSIYDLEADQLKQYLAEIAQTRGTLNPGYLNRQARVLGVLQSLISQKENEKGNKKILRWTVIAASAAILSAGIAALALYLQFRL